MRQIEKFFDIETSYSKKHKLNTCDKKVPQEYLDQIEKGCSIEQLETMMRNKFDVFKYKTQITIHGIFPELSTRRVGYYVNLTQNKNKSVGVRYNAIDYEKKTRLFQMLQTLGLWTIESNSTKYSLFRMKRLPSDWSKNREQIMEIVNEYKDAAEKIDKSLFVGNVSCYVAQGLFCYYMCLDVNICCFYERNFEKLFENLSGMTYAEGKKIYDEKVAEKERKDAEKKAELDAWYEQRNKEREAKKAALPERTKKFVEDHPLNGFVLTTNYIPQSGDIIAFVRNDYDFNLSWDIKRLKKCFGKMNATPCNENGEKIYSRLGGGVAKEIYPSVYVKRASA